MTVTIQSRRRTIVIVLLCVAVAGALTRQLAPTGTLRNVGTLLMLLWLPIVGNIIGWLVQKLRARRALAVPPEPDYPGAFQGHVRVELTLRPSQVPRHNAPLGQGDHRAALVLADEGFSARWIVPAGDALPRGTPKTIDMEFLAPATARPRFEPGTAFRVLIGESFIGDGRVLQRLDTAPTA